MRADLHSHTIYSDGVLDVKELMRCAKDAGLDVFAITDHDCFEGARIAYDAQDEMGIKMIFGLELSTVSNEENIHLLAYYNKPVNNGEIIDILNKQKMERKLRAEKIVSLLQENFGIKLDTKFMEEKNIVTRGTISSEIVRQGFAPSKNEVFKTMLGNGCPCYVPATQLSVQEGIRLIKESKGFCVLAHPYLYSKNDIEQIVKMGIDGIEVVYPHHSFEEQKYRDLAKKYKLFITGGSDFHSFNDYKHGNVGEACIKDRDLDKFLRKLENEC